MKLNSLAHREFLWKLGPCTFCLALLMTLLLFAGILLAQSPQIEWIHQFGTLAATEDTAEAIDAQGNIYVVGRTFGALEGQPSLSAGCFITKYDADGNSLWTREFAGDAYGNPQGGAYGVTVDMFGDVLVVGYTRIALSGQTSFGNSDAFLRKYDGDGNELWTRQFGTASYDFAYDVFTDSTGIYISGNTHGVFSGQTSAGSTDAFVCRFDLEGNIIWVRQFGTAGFDYGYGVSADTTGVYIVGHSSYNTYDSFVYKYDGSGNYLWSRLLHSDADFASAIDVSASPSGIYVAGGYGLWYGFVCRLDVNGLDVWNRTISSVRCKSVSADFTGVNITGLVFGGSLPGQPSFGGYDAYVRRYDNGGNEVWTRQFGTSSSDYGEGIVADDQGIYVTGYTYGTFPGQISAGSTDVFVRKYDMNGNEKWTRQFGGQGVASDIVYAVDTQDNIYVGGSVGGPLQGEGTAGGAFVRKYDDLGSEIWTRQFGTGRVHAIFSGSSGVYVAGISTALPGQSTGGAFIRKYSFDGNELWTRQFYDAIATAITLDGEENSYIAGYCYGSLPGQTGAGMQDAFVRKYDTSGNELWTQQFGSTNNDQALAICTDVTGVYVTGYTYDVLPGQASHGGYQDAFIRKYDLEGLELWTDQFGTNQSDMANDLCADISGIYVAGRTNGLFQGQTYNGNHDAYVRKYDPNGFEIWTRQFGSSLYAGDEAVAISTDSSGTIYVAGNTTGIFPGQTSVGFKDSFVRCYDSSGLAAWTFQFGTDRDDLAQGIATYSTGVVVGGYTNGTFLGQTSSGSSDAYVVRIKIIPPNSPPVANAGPDQLIEGTGATTPFTLNGSGSSDPDGDTLDYSWEDGGGNVVGTASTITLSRALGNYTFTLTVKDPAGLTSSDSVSITIQDTTPPALTAPQDITKDQSDPYGTPVTLGSPTVSDLCDPSPAVSNNAPALFSLGETTVTWTATDASGNSATAPQKITVVPGSPANQLSNLTKLIQYSVAAGAIDTELETSLLAKVASASAALARGNANDAKVAMNDLKALVNQVEAQTDKKITPEIAAEIIFWANRVIADLGS